MMSLNSCLIYQIRQRVAGYYSLSFLLLRIYKMNNTITHTTSNHKKESISNFLDASIDDVFIKGSKTYLRIKQLALPLEKFRKK